MRRLAAAKLNCWTVGGLSTSSVDKKPTRRTAQRQNPLTARKQVGRVSLAVQARNLFGPPIEPMKARFFFLVTLAASLPLVIFCLTQRLQRRVPGNGVQMGGSSGWGKMSSCSTRRSPTSCPLRHHFGPHGARALLPTPRPMDPRCQAWLACHACMGGRAERVTHFLWGTSVHTLREDVRRRRVSLSRRLTLRCTL